MAAATTRFAAAASKSNALADDDNTVGAKRAREAARDEDARLQAASVRLENAREALAKYGSAKIIGPGAPTGTTALLDAGTSSTRRKRLLRGWSRGSWSPRSMGGWTPQVKSTSGTLTEICFYRIRWTFTRS